MNHAIAKHAGRAARTAGLVLSLAFAALAATGAAAEGASMKLFKVVTQRDEVVIGLSSEELAAMGAGDVGAIADRLVTAGQITVWQYAVRKGSDGELEQAPRAKVAILKADSLRIEPYATPLRIVAPQ